MTRDFNQQPRDDSRPSFRNTSRNVSSNHDEDERSPRSNRPRLNREMVDRAWENGAPRVHADYQTRSNSARPPRNDGRAPRNNGQNSQYDDHSSHRGPGSYRPYGDRQDQRPGRSFDNNQRPRSQPFGANGSQSDDRRPNNRPGYNDRPDNRPSYNDRPDNRPSYNDRPNNRPGYNDRSDNRPGFGNRDRSASYQNTGPGRPPFNRPGNNDRFERSDNRSRPGFSNNDRPAPYQNSGPGRPAFNRSNEHSRPQPQSRGPQSRDQNDGLARRGADRHERNNPPKPNYRNNGGDGGYRPKISVPPVRTDKTDKPLHPRAQTRDWIKPNQQDEPLNEYTGNFEGDYEQFDTQQEAPRRVEAPRSRPSRPQDRERSNNQYRPQERHVTEVSDGHVLKGPRPAQRKNAQFWESVADDTNSLLEQVHITPQTDENIDTDLSTTPTDNSADPTSQTGEQRDSSAPGSRVTRRTPNALRKSKAGGPKARSRGPKPSRPGYKWPTP